MRSAPLVCAVAGLAACYRAPAFDEADACAIRCGTANACPSDRACSAGFCLLPGQAACTPGQDAAIPHADDADDAPPQDGRTIATSCTPGRYANATLFAAGQASFTTDNTNTVAEFATHDVRFDSLPLFSPYTLPRLAAGGTEIFLFTTPTAVLKRARFVAGAWETPSTVTITGIAGSFYPGTVSATNPRRMMVSVGTNTIAEGIEDANGAWAFSPVSFGFQASSQPSLSSDGLRVVFLGNSGAGADQVYVSARVTVTSAFTTPVSIFDFGTFSGTPHSPFLSSTDCDALYFDSNGDLYTAARDP